MNQQKWDPLEGLSSEDRDRLSVYVSLLGELNRKVNLVSRSTDDRRIERHVRHCLCLSLRSFPSQARVVDWGSGGGLPGVPLAVRFPGVQFHLVDAVAKKARALRLIVRELGLENVSVHHARAEHFDQPVDYAVSRATARLDLLWRWTRRAISPCVVGAERDHWQPGLICLKGGDVAQEAKRLGADDPSASIWLTDLGALTGFRDLHDKWMIGVRGIRAEE